MIYISVRAEPSNYHRNISQVGRATQSSQKDSNFRLEEKLRDTNNWRSELQSELDAVLGETELLVETRWALSDLTSLTSH